jgi:hypothetical protein
MIVVTITGLGFAVVMPAFGSLRKSLSGLMAREQVVQDIRGARQAAITQHCPVIVQFGNGVATTNLTYYTIHYDRNADGVKQASEPSRLRTMPATTKLSVVSLQPRDSLRFDVSGILRPGTGGGSLISETAHGRRDTFLVTVAGTVYRP